MIDTYETRIYETAIYGRRKLLQKMFQMQFSKRISFIGVGYKCLANHYLTA